MSIDAAAQPQSTLVALPDDVLLRHVGGEAVLLHLPTGTYFGLEPIGTRMLTLALQLADAAAVVAALEAEYVAEPERLARDLETLLGELAEASLVVREPAA